MNVICYLNPKDETSETLRRVLEDVSCEIVLEIYRNIENFKNRMWQPLGNVVLTLVRSSSTDDLERLVDMKERFEMVDVIVMTGSDGGGTDEIYYELRPRFVFRNDEHPEMIGLVLSRLLEKRQNRPKGVIT